jgi:hypothetical protein
MDMALAKAHATTFRAVTHAAVMGLWVLAWLLINTPVRMLMSVLATMLAVPMLASIHLDVLSACVLQASCWALTGRHVMVIQFVIQIVFNI